MPLLIQKELGENKLIIQTKAGQSLLADVIAMEQQHEERLKELEEEIREAERKNDLLSREELRGARAELEEAQAALERDRWRLIPPPSREIEGNLSTRIHRRQRLPRGEIPTTSLTQVGINVLGQFGRWLYRLLPPPEADHQREDELLY